MKKFLALMMALAFVPVGQVQAEPADVDGINTMAIPLLAFTAAGLQDPNLNTGVTFNFDGDGYQDSHQMFGYNVFSGLFGSNPLGKAELSAAWSVPWEWYEYDAFSWPKPDYNPSLGFILDFRVFDITPWWDWEDWWNLWTPGTPFGPGNPPLIPQEPAIFIGPMFSMEREQWELALGVSIVNIRF